MTTKQKYQDLDEKNSGIDFSNKKYIYVRYVSSSGVVCQRQFGTKNGYNLWIKTVGDQIQILSEDIPLNMEEGY